ncbi:hypothetical protein V502_05633 [Pseudogymnoascus sp. VKM F-4520 (FW-2644)]|nr:hypothetical protein V502_05633 [Pseudogymnoascus sp. VKM F-4520 (FW-2644)]
MTDITSMPPERSVGQEMPTGGVGKIQNNSFCIQLANQEKHDDFLPGTHLWLVLMTLSLVALMVSLDGSSISVALPVSAPVNVSTKGQESLKLIVPWIIAKQLNGTGIEALWSGTSFLLCCTVFQPSFGSFSNIFGRRPLMLTALMFFPVGTIVAGIPTNFLCMLIGRSLQGVGGGGVITLSEIIVTDLVPLRLRGQYFGIIGSMLSVGAVNGPLLGGGFSEKVSWSKLLRIDYAGTILFIGSSTSFLIPVTWGGVMYPWDSVQTLVPMIFGAVGLIVFPFYERSVSADPMMPMSIFKSRTAVVNYVGTLVHGLTLWSCLYYLPLYFEAVKEYSPVIAGVALFPNTFSVAPSAIMVGILITHTGYYRWAFWLGWILATLGMGLLCLLESNSSIPAWIFLMLVSGLGLGILFPSLVFAIQVSAKPINVAMAVAMSSFFR